MGLVFLLDANALIDMKSISVADQWEVFSALANHVDHGKVTIPLHVINEVGGPKVQHPDMPGAWAKGMQTRMRHALEADPTYVATVMAQTPNLLDPDADTEQADPYVLALALQLHGNGDSPVVVTKDRTDRPPRISLFTACSHFDIDCWWLEDFLAWLEGD